MSGWTMPIQQASFKGVRFDVLAVDDSFERAVVEHAYPFVNGADLEDMGLNTKLFGCKRSFLAQAITRTISAYFQFCSKRG